MADGDASLLRRFREGDQNAFRQLLDQHVTGAHAQVGRWLPARLQRRVSVADVLQEARMVAFERRADFEDRGQGAFRKWFLGIARHKVLELVKRHDLAARRSAQREVTRGQRQATAQFAGGLPSPSQAAIASEMREFAARAFRSLSDDYREVIRLVREEGLNLKEAAARIGRSHEATKKLYGRALAQFGKEFAQLRGETHGQG
ncbi:MAG: sigma-70 family RNA polymerase sigma factor [Planctomycetota bacterium]